MNIVLASAMAVGIAFSATAASAPPPVHSAPTAAVTPAKPAVKPVTATKPIVKPVVAVKPVVKVPAKPVAPAKPVVKAPAKPTVPAKPVVKPAPAKYFITPPTAAMQAEAWDNFSSDGFTTDDLSKGFGATYLGTTTNTDNFPNDDWYFEDSVSKPGVYHVFRLTFK